MQIFTANGWVDLDSDEDHLCWKCKERKAVLIVEGGQHKGDLPWAMCEECEP